MSTAINLFAAWWEPGTTGSFDVGDLSAIAGLLVAVSTLMTIATKRWLRSMRHIIKEEIERATEPIQPGSNGGLSLPDVAKRTKAVEEAMNDLKGQMDRSQTRIDEVHSLLLEIVTYTAKRDAARSSRIE